MVLIQYKGGYSETVTKKIFEGIMLTKKGLIHTYKYI